MGRPRKKNENQARHPAMQLHPTSSVYSRCSEKNFLETLHEDVSLNLMPLFPITMNIKVWQRNQLLQVLEEIVTKSTELLNTYYANNKDNSKLINGDKLNNTARQQEYNQHTEPGTSTSFDLAASKNYSDGLIAECHRNLGSIFSLEQNDVNIYMNDSIAISPESTTLPIDSAVDLSFRLSNGNSISQPIAVSPGRVILSEENLAEFWEQESPLDLSFKFDNPSEEVMNLSTREESDVRSPDQVQIDQQPEPVLPFDLAAFNIYCDHLLALAFSNLRNIFPNVPFENNIFDDMNVSYLSISDLLTNFIDRALQGYSKTYNNLIQVMNSNTSLNKESSLDNKHRFNKPKSSDETIPSNPSNSCESSTEETYSQLRALLEMPIEPLPNSSTSVHLPENAPQIDSRTKEKATYTALMRDLITDIVEPLASSSLSHVFESARMSCAHIEEPELLRDFYSYLLKTMIPLSPENVKTTCSKKINKAEGNKGKKQTYPKKAKEKTTAKIMSNEKKEAWKNILIKRYLNNDNMCSITLKFDGCRKNMKRSKIAGEDEQLSSSESRMILRPRNVFSYKEDYEIDTEDENEKSTQVNEKKLDFIGSNDRLETNFVLPSPPKTHKEETAIWISDDDNDQRSLGKSSSSRVTSGNRSGSSIANNLKPNMLSVLKPVKRDYFVFRRQVMQDFRSKAHAEKKLTAQKISNNFKAKRSIKMKFHRILSGTDSEDLGGSGKR